MHELFLIQILAIFCLVKSNKYQKYELDMNRKKNVHICVSENMKEQLTILMDLLKTNKV